MGRWIDISFTRTHFRHSLQEEIRVLPCLNQIVRNTIHREEQSLLQTAGTSLSMHMRRQACKSVSVTQGPSLVWKDNSSWIGPNERMPVLFPVLAAWIAWSMPITTP